MTGESLYPPTPGGIRMAIDSTPAHGRWWEEKVNWALQYETERLAEERMVLGAVLFAANTFPELFSRNDIDEINNALERHNAAWQSLRC